MSLVADVTRARSRHGRLPDVRIDWGDGDYARTSDVLAPAAVALLDAAEVAIGHRVLDIACGTGNVALAAASRGAIVTGVDAAERLVGQAQERADAAGLAAAFIVGEAEALPVADEAFDAALSSFGVIFAHPETAAREMVRVVRPGGILALTTWIDEGPISEVARLMMDALPPEESRARPGWGEEEWVRDLLIGAGASEVSFTPGSVAFRAESAEAWLRDQEEHHPVWRAMRRALPAEDRDALHAASVAVLAAANEDPAAFRTTSRYLIAVARR